MTRGHRGSLLLRRSELPSPSLCRFIPALRVGRIARPHQRSPTSTPREPRLPFVARDQHESEAVTNARHTTTPHAPPPFMTAVPTLPPCGSASPAPVKDDRDEVLASLRLAVPLRTPPGEPCLGGIWVQTVGSRLLAPDNLTSPTINPPRSPNKRVLHWIVDGAVCKAKGPR